MTEANLLRGIIPPMITPLKEQNQLDEGGLERLVDHLLSGGVQGLFVLGTTGEGPGLSYALRRQVIEKTCHLVGRRVPVLACITDTAFAESLSLARHAADCGVDAVVTAPPYYFPAGQAELLEYMEHLVEQLPLPLVLYNMPSHTKVQFEPATLERLSASEGIIGLKDSSGNLAYFHEALDVLARRSELSLLMGSENLLAEALRLGAHGGVCGGANVYPRLFVNLYDAALRRDGPEVARLQEVARHFARIYGFGRHWSSGIKGLKCALRLLGICNDFMAEPFHRFQAPEREQVRRHLMDAGLL